MSNQIFCMVNIIKNDSYLKIKTGHKSCNMLSVLNKLPLEKELQNFVTSNVFSDQKVKKQNNKIKHKNSCQSRN